MFHNLLKNYLNICNVSPDNAHYVLQLLKQYQTIYFVEDTVDNSTPSQKSAKKLRSIEELTLTQKSLMDNIPVALSQPIAMNEKPSTGEVVSMFKERDHIWFSQPVHFEDLILNTQLQMTQSPVDKVVLFCNLLKLK